MAQQDPLDLDWGDLGTAADDDILLTAYEPQLVALTLPAIARCRVYAVRRDPIAHGQVRTTNEVLTDLAS
jgi:hypothetical protein